MGRPNFGWLTITEEGQVTNTGLEGTIGELKGEVDHTVAQKGSKPSNAGEKAACIPDFPRKPDKRPETGKFQDRHLDHAFI